MKTACVVCIVLLLTGPAGAAPHFSDQGEPDALASALVASMDDREALGQVLMFGYSGQSPSPQILEWIRREGLGGVKIFGWNALSIPVLRDTVDTYQNAALSSRPGIPLLVATDQEGGWVRHVKGSSSVTPGNMALGAVGLPYDAWMTGRVIGEELAGAGINMNFAPVIDVFVNPNADVIGPRAFSSDPEWTGILGISYFRGHQEAGIISTAKHFPGHGDTADDSHGTLPVVLAGLDTLRARDLKPYQMLIAAGVPAVMAGHLAFPEITGNRNPATLSKILLTDVLRGELGFTGVTVTDDLFMRGARTDGASLPEVCYRAMMAGSDILLISQGPADHAAIHRHLLSEMADPVFNARVREAAQRIVAMKAAYLKNPAEELNLPDSGEFFLEQASRSITLVRDKRFPLPPDQAGRILLAGSYGDFFSEGLKRYPGALTWRLYSDDDPVSQGRALLRAARNYDTVITLLHDESSAVLLDQLEPVSEKVVVISVLTPVYLQQLSWVSTALAAFGSGPESFRAAFAALAGDFVPRGQMPFPLGAEP